MSILIEPTKDLWSAFKDLIMTTTRNSITSIVENACELLEVVGQSGTRHACPA